MIVFEGEVSKKCHHYIAKKEGKTSFWAMLVAVIVVLTPVSIFLSMAGAPWFAVAAVVAPIALLGVILPLIAPYSQRSYHLITPKKITIRGDGTMISQGDTVTLEQNVRNVRWVLDFGEWYHIVFRSKFDQGRFVCQKDLLVKGTMEEFESLFEGKIIRK